MTALAYLLSVLCGVGVLQGLYLACLLWRRSTPDPISNRLLAFCVGGTSLRVSKPLLVLYATLPPALEALGLLASLLAWPALLLFLRERLQPARRWERNDVWHALPAALYLLWCMTKPPYHPVVYAMILFQNVAYLGGAWYLLQRHQAAYPPSPFKGLIWLTGAMTLILLSYLYAWLVEAPVLVMLKTATMGYTGLVTLLSYSLTQQKFLFAEPGPVRYERSRLRSDDSKVLYRQLEQIVRREQLYLNPSLSVQLLARTTGFGAREVSQAINENSGTNFSDWLNGFRVEEAMRRLADPDSSGEKIAAIAFDCGFNTISSFNTVFKAKTTYTPSEYRERCRVGSH